MTDGTSADAFSATTWLPRRPRTSGKRGILARPTVAILSSFPPRECGIATFARDLIGAIESSSYLLQLTHIRMSHPLVIAMNEAGQTYEYDGRVRWQIDRDSREQYVQAADSINRSGVKLVSVQHEYGLFGGEHGEYLLDFLDRVRRPVVLTMHTVLERPSHSLRLVTEQLINKSDAVVVLAESARDILATYYRRADLGKLTLIPHGTPVVRREAVGRCKDELGLAGHTVLSTFGLLGPDKGIEHAIRALPEIIADHPDVIYLVLGQTHPGQRKHSGETYRQMLVELVDELGLRNHVRFYNRYLSLNELLRFLQATDVYVMPYLNPQQIVSGTLAYATACGKAVVATPFTYAREMLSDQRGMLAEFHDAGSIARAVRSLLDDPALKEQVETRAYNHGRRMHWPAVGKSYCRLFQRVIDADRARLRESARRAYRRVARTGLRPAGSGLAVDLGLPALPAPRAVGARELATGRGVSAQPARGAALGNGLGPLGSTSAGGGRGEQLRPAPLA
jgi:glycosyltransferase involved in cell wall biosynthesis